MKNISFVTMGQGNPEATYRTFKSFFGTICNEIIYGDLCLFTEDKKIIESYKDEFNLKIVEFPFNYLYKNGFSSCLNLLSQHASNDLCLYNNVGEIIDGEERALRLINEKFPEYNAYAINHGIETHTWTRCWDKNEIEWSGMIHEELRPKEGFEMKLCPYYIFQFKDSDKDMNDWLKALVYDDVKNLTYNRNYIRLIEEPEKQGATNDWWVIFAKNNYESMKHRLFDKGLRREAFEEGDIEKYLNDVNQNPLFKREVFESDKLIEYQNSTRSL